MEQMRLAEINAKTAPPAVEPLPDNIRSIQPGGGAVQTLERGWCKLRRGFLKTFRPGYVRKMRERLKGDRTSCPVDVIDSRDLKLYRNVAECWFEPADDRFAWRDRLPFARSGFAELIVFGVGSALLAAAIVAVSLALPSVADLWALTAILPALIAAFVFYFFRDPEREIPSEPGAVVSPADGRIIEVAEVDAAEFIGEPAIRIAIFLSVFNVHVNRISRSGKLVRVRYTPGKFISAYKPSAAEENERMELYFVEPEPPHRRFLIRQVAGLVARRIVCEIPLGKVLDIGQRFGIIKFGSRTELLLPRQGFEVMVKTGDRVKGGATQLGRYIEQEV